MKKLGAALLVFLLCASPPLAMAQDNSVAGSVEWLTFSPAEGLQAYRPDDEKRPLPPEGMEVMYSWMEANGAIGEAVLVRMPAGRVLASVCRTDMGATLSAQTLCSLWPQMAQVLDMSSLFVNGDRTCASVVRWAERDWMCVKTVLVLGENQLHFFNLTGYANCDNGVMVEIWLASSMGDTYVNNETASAELTADIAAAEGWLGSIRINEEALLQSPAQTPGESMAASMAPGENLISYQDPLGRFSLFVPENAIIIAPEDLPRKIVTAQKDVADSAKLPLYRYWLTEANAAQSTLITEPAYQSAMLVTTRVAKTLKTLEDLEAMAPAIEAYLSQNLDGTLQIPQPKRTSLAGNEATSFLYTGNYRGREISLLALMFIQQGSFYEINLWSTDGSADWPDAMKQMLHSFSN